MQSFKDDKSVCTKCNCDMQKKDSRPEELDNIRQSLVVMFRIRELVLLECPTCGERGMRF